jgi:hypothetical protein
MARTSIMTFDDVDAFATALPGVTVGARWGNRTWLVKDKGFAWQRPLSKADIKRLGDAPVPTGELLAVNVQSLDARDALLAIAPPGFFTIAHFQGYPAFLIELRRARAKDVKAAILDAYHLLASALPIPARPAKPRRRPASRARAKAR